MHADITHQKELVSRTQEALNEAREALEQQHAVVAQAEADKKAAQAAAAASAETARLQRESEDQHTEESMRAVCEADVKLQEAKVRSAHILGSICGSGIREWLKQLPAP